MKIFITGGTGFIGRFVVEILKKRGHQLLILSRESRKENGVNFVKGDLSNIDQWKRRLKVFKPVVAIHLAWEGIPDFSYAQSSKNFKGSLALFETLVDIGCRKIIVAGTWFEYGSRIGKVHEEMNIKPLNSFTAAKHALHLMGEELAKERGIDFIWFRIFNPYGYGQRDGSLIPYIMRCISENTPLILKNPLAQGDFVYVTDTARAIAAAVSRGKGCVTYNIGSGRLMPVRDIARIVCDNMSAGREYYKDFAHTAIGKLIPAAYADLKKVQQGIGWRPLVSIKTGIQRTIRAHASR